MSKRRRFSGELKAKIALHTLRIDRTLQETSSKHQMHPNEVGAWKRQAIKGLSAIFSGGGSAGRGIMRARFAIFTPGSGR
ncbi:MAG: transposase [Rhodospirillaceae bacterium]|nr:transposase [Rhodospirillaceae bacterium]MCY4239753.1 transposase [Rhodospirillaceae bacterium]